MEERDFPGGPLVKNLPCSAGDVGSIPSWGIQILQAVRLLSPHALEPTLHNRRSQHNEKPSHSN